MLAGYWFYNAHNVQVWNISDGTHVARYMGHQQALAACCFHPSDPYRVFTGTDKVERNFALQSWDYRDHPFQKNLPHSKPPCVAIPVKAGNEVSKIFNAIHDKPSTANVAPKEPLEVKQAKRAVKPDPKKDKSKVKKSLLPCTSNMLVNSPHSQLSDELQFLVDAKPMELTGQTHIQNGNTPALEDDSTSELGDSVDFKVKDTSLHLGLLGTRKNCRKQLEFESTYCIKY
jgi:hypothetical protein